MASDRGVRALERFGLDGPLDRWRPSRSHPRCALCPGVRPHRKTFTQFYGSRQLDASQLMLPLVGFFDPRMHESTGLWPSSESWWWTPSFGGTKRHRPGEIDALPAGEGVFLPCTFWLADNYLLQGRRDEARQLFERLLAIADDVGLLSEEYDPCSQRLLGNFRRPSRTCP